MLARTLKIAATTLILGVTTPVLSETLAIDGQVTIKPSGVETPQRGSSMDAVQAKFGEPSNKSGPVGSPAITKWFYPHFVVVFENDKVLHSVVVSG
ncbi:MAG: uncharacterized protein K0Q92_522 [Steroidobacteraceae bacterium]|jgi:hypothetical protein|nr:uncharacterized protein [Steroidobacteraceae bacterium]